MEKTPSTFQKERERTDKSLTVERKKVDASLTGVRRSVESEADVESENRRREADDQRRKRRSRLDEKFDSSKAKSNLKAERNSEDAAIEDERMNADAVLEQERGKKETVVNKLLHQDRAATDRNLSDERTQTDSRAQQSLGLLTEEQAAHLQTKTALTTREEFVAIVSHDLRNPIGAIVSCSDLLLNDPSYEVASEDLTKMIQMIQRNAKSALRLINDLLDMERVAKGKLSLNLAENNLGELVRETVDSNAYSAAAKSISLEIQNPEAGGDVVCDKDRITQVLGNLIDNAVKFTPRGGKVTVALQSSEHEVQLSVRDTGAGIPDVEQSHIFDRFAQIGNKNRVGLGLGLYISRMITELHGGEIGVKSSPGQGSEFHFTLPKLGPSVG